MDAENIAFGRPEMVDLDAFASPPGIGHRMVAFDTENFYAYHHELQRRGYDTALVLTGQSYPDANDYPWHSRRWAEVVKPTVWILANEWNVQHAATWPERPAGDGDRAFVDYWNLTAPAMKSVDPTCVLYLGGLFSEPDLIAHIERVWARLTPKPDGIDMHPYLERPQDAERLLRDLRATFNCEIGVFEWNDHTASGVTQFQKILDARTEHSCFMCWSDGQTPEELLGLIRVSGVRKPTYRTLSRAYKNG